MRSPFEIVILVACALTGLIGLLTGNASPASISVAFAGWAAIWNIGVLVGGVGTLVALWCKAPLNYLLERVGMVWLTTLFLAYAVAIGVVNDQPRVVAGLGSNLALAFACLVRAWQLTDQLRRLRAALSAG